MCLRNMGDDDDVGADDADAGEVELCADHMHNYYTMYIIVGCLYIHHSHSK